MLITNCICLIYIIQKRLEYSNHLKSNQLKYRYQIIFDYSKVIKNI